MSKGIAALLISIWFSTIASTHLSVRNFLDTDTSNADTNFDQSWVTITAKSEEISAYPGEIIELECEASGSPQPAIEFYNRASVLSGNNVLASSSSPLVKSTARWRLVAEKSEVIFCKATSGSKTAHAAIKIFVAGSQLGLLNNDGFHFEASQRKVPRITFFDTTYVENIGNTVILPCSSTGNENADTIWLDVNGKVLDNTLDERFAVSSGHLRIKNIMWSDMGLYTCVIKNNFGEDAITTFLYPMLAEE
ncbi:putative immunoglobulin [Trypoxylus dichotomus]